MPQSIDALTQAGQSVWLDFIRRSMLDSGELDRYVDEGWITGLTSNPTIFARAIAGSTDYDDEIREIARGGETSAYAAFVRLAAADIRRAADALRPVYDRTGADDGYVSLEAPPGIEHDAERTVAEVERLFALVDRPNLMIKVPGTEAGIQALERLIAAGVNINITLLFDVAVYERVAKGYIAGLEQRLERGEPLGAIASVASFFVSRVDSAVDPTLPEGSSLRGTAAIANALAAYALFQQLFSGQRWEELAGAGARVQRPLWGSTSTKDPAYSDVMYVEQLIVPHTVNTIPEPTLRAFADHGTGAAIPAEAVANAEQQLAELAAAGVDLAAVTDRLLEDGLASFAADFDGLLACIGKALAAIQNERFHHAGSLGPLAGAVDDRLSRMANDDVVRRAWAGDHTLWKPDPTEIEDRLGWLTVIDAMSEQLPDLRSFASEVTADGYTTAVLMGMGGSSLAPEVFSKTFGTAQGALTLEVLDTTDPADIAAVDGQLDLDRTLFIVASKSGTTLETLSHLAYFWERIPDGAHFIAITDPGTPLEATARERGFRRVFANPPEIGGRYSALSYFGLVPAALLGVDLEPLLARASEMQLACDECVPAPDNPGAWLGAVLGEGALAGRDQLTLLLPDALASLGTWIEQLIAESTGKEGRGILPVEGEPLGPPGVYGDRRLFVAIGHHDGLDALEAAGHPVVRLPYDGDPQQLGAEFFRWEFATAIAGHVLGINAFDQPNVQQAKDATARILGGDEAVPDTLALSELLDGVGAGDYVAIQAYVPRTAEFDARLQGARLKLRDRLRVPTTVGYGPRFLHSTGQLHKGGPDGGRFIQVIDDDAVADLSIPGQPYTFGTLKRAQALGDLVSLLTLGRRVARVTLDELTQGS